MDVETVICIDNSGSTDGNTAYFRKVEKILAEAKRKVVILWNSNAVMVDPTTAHFESTGGTAPSSFLNILKTFEHDFDLIVATDGEIWDGELSQCQRIIDETRLLDKINSFTIHFIGDENRMNLRISSLFNDVAGERKIVINEEEAIEIRDFKADKIREMTYEDFLNERSMKANVLTMMQRYPQNIREIRAEICKVTSKIIVEDLADASLRSFYDSNDIDGCVEFVKKVDNTRKKNFQRIVSKVLGLFNAKDCYSLSHLSNTSELRDEDIEVEGDIEDDDGDDESENDLICDILYKKIEHLCILVKMLPVENSTNEDKFALIPDSVSKKYSANPFMILKDKVVIERIVKRVEPQKIDLFTYNSLERELDGRARSPFSRDQLKGVFIFHSAEDESRYYRIYKNNNRTLSFIFGSNNKLPGNKALWNALFLYVLLKHHEGWKQHEATLKEEILFICSHARSFVTFNPILNPTIMENLDVCLWYVVEVAHEAFPNAHSNVLRSMEGSEELIEFYSYLFDVQDTADVRHKVKKWVLWKNFVRNRSDWKVKLDVISHIQNFETINGSTVFFSGKSTTNSFGLDPSEVIELYVLLKQSQNPTLMDDLSKPIRVKCEPIEVSLNSYDDLNHVFICVSTCNQLVTCPLTKLHWRDCLRTVVVSEEGLDVEKYSYFRLFKRFCRMYGRYPGDEEELLVFHSDAYNRRHDDYVVYPMNVKESLRLVLDKFADVMKEHDVRTYLKLSDSYSAESERLKMEEQCRKCSFHEKLDC